MSKENQNQSPLLRLDSVSLYMAVTNLVLLENISFDLQKGDFMAIIGSSGAGKSTLLRLLNRLVDPSSGTIHFENQNSKNLSPFTLRRQIVLVPQEPKLLGMTVQKALSYPLELLKLTPAQINSRIRDLMIQLNISEDWLERKEFQLSVGQRQLVAIARGLIMQPEILLLDEPTSALDIGKANFLLKFLAELSKNNRITILMISHQLELLKQYVNRVIFLEKGYLIEDDLTKNIDWQNVKNKLSDIKSNEDLDSFN